MDKFSDTWRRWYGAHIEYKTVWFQKVHHEQAEVLYKAGVTIYKWYRTPQPYSRVYAYTQYPTLSDTGWCSRHIEACRQRELNRIHKGKPHHRTLKSEQRGTVSYCVMLEES